MTIKWNKLSNKKPPHDDFTVLTTEPVVPGEVGVFMATWFIKGSELAPFNCCEDGFYTFCDEFGWVQCDQVIAWSYLPQPYKEEVHE